MKMIEDPRELLGKTISGIFVNESQDRIAIRCDDLLLNMDYCEIFAGVEYLAPEVRRDTGFITHEEYVQLQAERIEKEKKEAAELTASLLRHYKEMVRRLEADLKGTDT